MKNPSIINTYDLPLAANVCNQELREIIALARVSVAHVIMQPQAISLSHKHQKMREIYYILSGKGVFYKDNARFEVEKWSQVVLPPGDIHKLENIWEKTLEHLVFAIPPFDPADVKPVDDEETKYDEIIPATPKQDPTFLAKDGWIVGELLSKDEQVQTDISLAEWYLPPHRKAKPHYHKIGEELYYIVSWTGIGKVWDLDASIKKGDVIYIPTDTVHSLENETWENLEIVCVCTPPYQDDDFLIKENI